ncbi:MAG: hypothetical protein RL233_1959, partial [Bacteroidota bacterium]
YFNNNGKYVSVNTATKKATNFKSIKMTIYNRWGEKLFEGDASTNGWDGYYKGLRCMSGYYVYLIYTQYTDLNGNSKSNVYNGTVLLLE